MIRPVAMACPGASAVAPSSGNPSAKSGVNIVAPSTDAAHAVVQITRPMGSIHQ
ncbi:MAG: hypothetical protein HYV20_07715 [Gemmatimonadetes bacterium]|nr:hypothetical protein [Gemmatimonadota bacterium]